MPVAIVLVIGGGMYLMGHTDIWEPANLGGLSACLSEAAQSPDQEC